MADEIARSKRKKVSKKSKRSWRKHTDIKDVEEHLEEVRRDERTGGAAAEKPDERLFFVDKETKEEYVQKHDRGTRRSKKRKILKADQLLLPEPFFKPVGGKKRKINKKLQRKRMGGDSDHESSGSENEAEEASQTKTTKYPSDPHKRVASYDLWATEDKLEGDEHFLRTTRKTKIKAPKTLNRKTSQKPAIEVCSPGASYNPTYEDHQDLLKTAHEVEVKKLKEIQKIERKLQFPTAEEMALLPSWEEEMSQGLFGENEEEDDEEINDDDGNDDGDETVVVKPVRAVNRKTKQDRMKLQEQREADRKVQEEKEKASRQNQIYRLKLIKKEIRNKEEQQEKRQKKKEEKEKKYADEPKRLGKFQYQQPEIEIQLSDELTGNVRALKPEGSLLQDRYKSFQRRNMIEPRKRIVPHRKFALKEYERRSSKKPCIKEI